MLAHVVAGAAALHDVVELLVRHHLRRALMQRREDALRGQRQVDALTLPQRAALPERVQLQRVRRGRGRLGARAGPRGAQDVEEGVDEFGLVEAGLLQVVPGVERLHDPAIDRRRHRRHHQHRRAGAQLVDLVDQRDAGIALAAELDVEHDHLVALAGQRGLGGVAVEPLIDLQLGPRGADPAGQLLAGGAVVLDDGDLVPGDDHGAGLSTAPAARAPPPREGFFRTVKGGATRPH